MVLDLSLIFCALHLSLVKRKEKLPITCTALDLSLKKKYHTLLPVGKGVVGLFTWYNIGFVFEKIFFVFVKGGIGVV